MPFLIISQVLIVLYRRNGHSIGYRLVFHSIVPDFSRIVVGSRVYYPFQLSSVALG